jgi:hypothetical protein
MISLVDSLPEDIQIDGVLYPINWHFQSGIQFEELMKDDTLSNEQRLLKALILYFPDKIPSDVLEALEGILWFFKGGVQDELSNEKGKSKGSSGPDYCFSQDAGLIYTAFMQAYNIDLFKAKKLHWWAFRELLAGLPEDCLFSKVLSYRTISITANMPKEQKEFYKKMKDRYRLKEATQAIERINEIEDILIRGDIGKLKGGE